MAMRDAAPLLSLLGHELRAPAGVIGGYLTLIERAADRLSPDQQQAVAGARRAQQRLVEILDDASRLVATWKADDGATGALPLASLLDGVRATATAQGIALAIDGHGEGTVALGASRAALVDALVAVAAAVAREHGAGVLVSVSHDAAAGVTCLVRPDGPGVSPSPAGGEREPFNLWRPGLGLRLVVAATVLVDAGTELHEVVADGKRVGVDITWPAYG